MDESKSVAGAAAMLLACLFVVSSAVAREPSDQMRSETVKFQDLNVTAAAGVDTLYNRIHSAAQRVCSMSGQHGLGGASASATCAKEAQDRAIEKVNLPALTAYGQPKTPDVNR